MLQSDGEPAWQGKTYNALKDKKHLTGINKEERVKEGRGISDPAFTFWQVNIGLTFNGYWMVIEIQILPKNSVWKTDNSYRLEKYVLAIHMII